MRRIAPALLVLLGVALAHGAQGGAGEWIRYTSTEGRYSVKLPAEPKVSSQDSTAPSGEKLKQYLAQATDSNSLAMIGYFDYPAGGSFDFDKGRDGMVGAVKGTLVSEKPISLGDNPGRELRVSVKAPTGEDFIVRARFYDVSGRVYVVQIIYRKAEESPALTEKAEKYFDSFSVKTAK
jgi:hypothetical protein